MILKQIHQRAREDFLIYSLYSSYETHTTHTNWFIISHQHKTQSN